MTFLLIRHPLSLRLILLIQTTLIAIQSGIVRLRFWFSYIIFLIIVGGILVLFIYITRIASNEKFTIKFKLITISAVMIILSLIFSNLDFITLETLSIIWKSRERLQLVKYLNFPTNFIILTIIIYLLITLIAVANISNVKYGPLRQKF